MKILSGILVVIAVFVYLSHISNKRKQLKDQKELENARRCPYKI